jgi:hypothetical protein
MKPVLMRAVACECLLLLLTLFGARAQQPARDLTTPQIEDLMNDAASLGTTGRPEAQITSPNQQAQLRWYVNLPWHLQWTTSAYFVGRLVYQKIPSYTRPDTSLAWHPLDTISLGLVGQNLVKGLHQEYNGSDLTEIPSLIRRSAYGRSTWRF